MRRCFLVALLFWDVFDISAMKQIDSPFTQERTDKSFTHVITGLPPNSTEESILTGWASIVDASKHPIEQILFRRNKNDNCPLTALIRVKNAEGVESSFRSVFAMGADKVNISAFDPHYKSPRNIKRRHFTMQSRNDDRRGYEFHDDRSRDPFERNDDRRGYEFHDDRSRDPFEESPPSNYQPRHCLQPQRQSYDYDAWRWGYGGLSYLPYPPYPPYQPAPATFATQALPPPMYPYAPPHSAQRMPYPPPPATAQ